MRLRTTRPAADERLGLLLVEGFEILQQAQTSFQNHSFDLDIHNARINTWGSTTLKALLDVFPTNLENNMFNNASTRRTYWSGADQPFHEAVDRLKDHLDVLEKLRSRDYLSRYADLPIEERIYVEAVDSFHRVRDVNAAEILDRLDHGYLDLSENDVQLALERILEVDFHKKDWGGEQNDLYTANVVVSGRRRATAFLLKGPSIGRREMTIANCGKNADQLVRLFGTPAELFVVQCNGPIAEAVISDALGKTRLLRASGRDANLLVIDGQDTARLLRAYGELP